MIGCFVLHLEVSGAVGGRFDSYETRLVIKGIAKGGADLEER